MMIDHAGIALLGVVAMIFLLSILATHITLRKDSWKVQKYKLYKVRDNLIYLVATNKIREDDLVFQRLYKAVNYFIDSNDHITFRQFVAAAERARKKGLDLADEKAHREITAALHKLGPEANEVVISFYSAILDILIENSLRLRLIIKCGSLAKSLIFLTDSLDRKHVGKSTLRLYNEYSRAAAA